ncbi:hypothetical protein ACVIJ6_005029 [Bradyrhizobium sp. USDA 4369]
MNTVRKPIARVAKQKHWGAAEHHNDHVLRSRGATTELQMIRSAILGASLVATALAGPAMARDMHHRHMARHDAAMMQQRDDAGMMQRRGDAGMMQRRGDAGWNNAGWNNNGWNNDWNRRSTGFWPADVAAGAVGTAAGVAGAAIGTAGAIATAPFRTPDAYAYDAGPNRFGQPTYDRGPNGYYGDWNSYATRNGLVCRPGTMFKGSDGAMHICQ